MTGTPEWMSGAACRGSDVELFFPERGAPTSDAKAVCNDCPVQTQCLAYAIGNGEKWGIWGGVSEHGRKRMRRGRGRKVPDHGTRARYRSLSHPCECDRCDAANSAYNAAAHQRQRQKRRAG